MSVASARDPLYRGYRFPAELINSAVWLSYRFHLSHRDIEDLLAERGVRVSHEGIQLWCRAFGPVAAAGGAPPALSGGRHVTPLRRAARAGFARSTSPEPEAAPARGAQERDSRRGEAVVPRTGVATYVEHSILDEGVIRALAEGIDLPDSEAP